ncbi:fimbrial biogenesis chaperone [Enterobacter hormaechei]|uniref:fimbrial biogenesis chaperone n=1 Tax=Enterobacter TaxID=547 RepID=UPI000F674FA4|nr:MULTISPECIES: fimbria/pilus periplasmic chaperone [Enterobacter]EGQ5280652.1 fimbria/pilus periplasmic chaperone [Enterobacter hormaechei]EGQ5283976.1 fimbria/pilus periplasmic chaperone [Enterobacter hormaechei]EHN8831691.1 fimbria/pilus periplasmic chaperone [Enterobacter hormaechei]EHN8890465.1 fimbria/pilus periplasmic chaperone [Enterobacter hormaechei]MBN4761784.1 fimbria/pilus periplasmic chaperone [Enterobacter hormaechei]
MIRKFIFSLALFSTVAQASIVITGTRVIYPASSKEVTVKVSNKGESPVLIQSWLDNGDTNAKPDKIKVPFVLTPPINRVEPSSGQTLRIRALPNNLSQKQESIFWLNVLEIPAKPKEDVVEKNNYLQVAFRSRIKFFYRPSSLKGSLAEAAKTLQWTHSGKGLHVKNSSPYHVSLVQVSVGKKHVDGKMLKPFSEMDYALPATSGSQLTASYVNDYGAVIPVKFTLK